MDTECVCFGWVLLDRNELSVAMESTAELRNEGEDEEAVVVPMSRFVAALKDDAVDTEPRGILCVDVILSE